VTVPDISPADGLFEVLHLAIQDVLWQEPSISRARALAHVVGIGIRAVQSVELVERVEALEVAEPRDLAGQLPTRSFNSSKKFSTKSVSELLQ